MLRLPGLFSLPSALMGLLFVSSSLAHANSGVLDLPLPASETEVTISEQQPAPVRNAQNPESANKALRTELAKEQKELEKLPREELQARAENGERAAQVTLAEDFAEEASLLSFAPDAANDALSDAARWYSMAAEQGFPGAPSLDTAGVKFYPIRVQRSR